MIFLLSGRIYAILIITDYYISVFQNYRADLTHEVLSMKKNESSEDYLETILILSKKKPVVRGVDIAEELGYKKSSVSVAMKHLRENRQITVTKEGYIYLTDAGLKIAEMIYERHQLLSSWLVFLGVDEDTALEDACRLEHDLSEQSFLKLKEHILSSMKPAGI